MICLGQFTSFDLDRFLKEKSLVVTGCKPFEKFVIKVRKVISIPENTYVMPVNGVGSVYGDYRNNLSVTADDIKILQPTKQ